MEKHFEAYASAFAPHGVMLEQHEVFANEGRGSRDVAVAVSRARGLGLTDTQLDALAKEKQRVFASFGPMPKYGGVDELIVRLKARGLRLALVTGTSQVNLQNHFGAWLSNFDVTVTADDVERTKPDPEPYRKALEKLGIRAAEAIVVENAPLGIQSAKGAGLRVIAITTTNQADALKEADQVVGSINDVEALL
jgi:HAD superfamily hydrolase (TIGR01509 family)